MKYSLSNRNTLPKVIFIILALYFFSSNVYSQEYDVIWKHTQGADYDTINNIITKTESNGWNNCGAISYNRLKRNNDGYLKYVIIDIDTKKAFGLSTNNNDPRLRSIDYGFVLNNNKLLILEHGKLKGNYGKIKIGDTLKIERNNNRIKYYKNNILLRNKGTNPNFKLFVDVSINSNGASFSGFKTSFAKNIKIFYTKEDVDCFSKQDSGKIVLDIRGGVSPYNVIWNTGQTTSTITNLSKGIYTVTVTDQLGLEKIKTININTAVLWNIDTGIVILNDSLQKTTVDGWGNAGAHSYNDIDSLNDGYLTFTINKPWIKKAVGFSSENINSHFNTIEHCFVISNNKLFIYENGQFKGKFGKVKIGTVLKIKKQGDKFYYYKNNKLKKTTNGDDTKQYFVDIALFKQNSFLEPIYVDFCPVIEDIQVNYTTEMNGCDTGSVYVTVTGGIPPYTYVWSNGSTESSLLDVPKGEYNLIVKDYLGTIKTEYITLSPELIWTDLVGVEVNVDTLIKTAESGWGNGGAASENILLANEDGFVSCILKDHNAKVIGLSHTNEDAHYKNIDYGFFSSKEGIYIVENGKLIGSYGYWKIEVKLKIEKKGHIISYWVNDNLVKNTEIIEPVNLLVDITIYDKNSYFNDVKVTFCRYEPIVVDYTINNITLDSLGSIQLDVSGGVPPYSYLWNYDKLPTIEDIQTSIDTIAILDSFNINADSIYNSFITTYTNNYLNNLTEGSYSCIITDAIGQNVKYNIPVNEPIEFSNRIGFNFTNNKLEKTEDGGFGTSKAIFGSPFSISKESKISFTVAKNNLNSLIGLVDNNKEPTNFEDFKFGIFFDNGNLKIIEDGILIEKTIQAKRGDEIEIRSENNNIIVSVNRSTIHSFSNIGTSTLLSAFSLGTIGANFIGIGIQLPPVIFGEVTNSYCGVSNMNKIEMHTLWLTGVQYQWYKGLNSTTIISTDNSIEDLEPGWYRVTLTGNTTYMTSIVRHYSYFVGNYVNWITTDLDLTLINKLTLNSSSSWTDNYANSLNHADLSINEEWVNYFFKHNLTNNFEIIKLGLKENNSTNSFTNMLRGIVILNYYGNSYYWYVEDGQFNFSQSNSSTNDNFDLYFKIQGQDVTLYRKLGNIIQILNNFQPTSTNLDFGLITKIITQGTSVEQTLATFCMPTQCPYNVLKKTLDGGYAKTNYGNLRFKYNEEYFVEDNIDLLYKVYDFEGGSEMTPITTGINFVTYGDNRYELDLSGSNLTVGKYYILEINNKKGEKWYLKFLVDDVSSGYCD